MIQQKLSLLSIIAFITISIDQLTKLYVRINFKLDDTLAIIPNVFHITSARNYGVAFGLLEKSAESFRDNFLLVVPAISCLIIITLLLQSTRTSQNVAMSFVFGGALGNYIDRINTGYVIDFVDIRLTKTLSFPIFNLADSAIVLGIIIFFCSLVFESRQLKKTQETVAPLETHS